MRAMKTYRPFALLPALFITTAGFAAQSVPEAPAIAREVTGVTNLWVGTNATPMFTRPHIPGLRTSADGRIGVICEGGGVGGSTPRFALLMPEKMTNYFQNLPPNPDGFTMSSTNFKFLDGYTSGNNGTNFTLYGQGVSHASLWDTSNCVVNANGEDVYSLRVVVTSRTVTNNVNYLRIFSTPIQVVVTNAKTTNAFIRSITKTGATTGGPLFTNCSGFEPVVVGDGRLLVFRVGSGSRTWINPSNNIAQPASAMDTVYSYYTNGAAADATKWTNVVPISFAPYDPRINGKFGFALRPFRDTDGNLIPPGEDIGGSYPWMDREAKNLFLECVFDMLHYATFTTNGSVITTNWNNGRYPQTRVPEEPADYQGEDGGKHQGVAFLGLWSHGKLVQLDNLNNEMDYAIGQGDAPPGPQQRLVNLYLTNSGPYGNESGWLRLGRGRSTVKMPRGENDNGNIIDSLENLFNYREYFRPTSLRDVAWSVTDGNHTDELSFDDYLDPDAFIIANMAGALTFPSNATSVGGFNSYTHHSGWNVSTKTFTQPVKLQNAATAVTNRWLVPKHGLVIGPGRLEPAASGGVHGKGFWMDGTIGLEFTVTNQPQSVTAKDWYVGIFVDCRHPDDGIERRLLTFPDNTSIRLYGRSQVLYADQNGAILNRISIPPVSTNAPVTAMDDVLPDRDWAHLAFQTRKQGTEVDFHLNGLIFNRWADGYSSLFQMTPGKLTVGTNAGSALPGFTGWIDEFKVIAHAVDIETACNHANGTLIGLPGSYTNVWKTKFADRFPTWTHDEITKALRNNGETNFPRYANYYDYRRDNGAHRGNIPAGTVSLRQAVHFPEGPLFHNAPRPHSAANAFCLSCHHPAADGGLDITAITLDTTWTAANDPRRQPMQPPAKIHGRIPAGLISAFGLPTVATNTPVTGQLIDQWMLPAFGNAVAVQTFTLMDATTQRDLLHLTNGTLIDPARLGTSNFTVRANLDHAQSNVAMKLDATGNNTKSRPPFTLLGTTNNPYVGTAFAAGAHTITATPALGAVATVNFSMITNGTTRLIADYRDDFKTHAPLPGWSYEWNEAGTVFDRANYRFLSWTTSGGSRYAVRGFPVYPDNGVSVAPYVALTSTGGHPGRGTTQGSGVDRFAIASYTAKLSGYYGIINSLVSANSGSGNGGQLLIFADINGGATYTNLLNFTYGPATTNTFNGNLGFFQAGDTISVCVGPNGSDSSDGFSLDFSIGFKETGNPF
jgi:hypothetical protein